MCKARETGELRLSCIDLHRADVYSEYVQDIARASNEAGIKTVVISAGYIKEKPLLDMLSKISAIKIDLKSFSNDYYKRICNTTLGPVLETLKTIKASGVWFEIVNLILPTLNDSLSEHKQMFEWILSNLGPAVPVHLTRFHPTYKMKRLPSTPKSTLEKLHKLAKEMGLRFPYIGNVPGNPAENTYCPKCGKLLIERRGFEVSSVNIVSSKCRFCGERIEGVWSSTIEKRRALVG